VFVERGKLAVAPIFVKDVKPQRVALDDEVVESRHRVWVIARAAHHSAKFLAHLLNNEELFWSSDAESQPYANDISLRQFGLPWAWLNVGQAVCSACAGQPSAAESGWRRRLTLRPARSMEVQPDAERRHRRVAGIRCRSTETVLHYQEGWRQASRYGVRHMR